MLKSHDLLAGLVRRRTPANESIYRQFTDDECESITVTSTTNTTSDIIEQCEEPPAIIEENTSSIVHVDCNPFVLDQSNACDVFGAAPFNSQRQNHASSKQSPPPPATISQADLICPFDDSDDTYCIRGVVVPTLPFTGDLLTPISPSTTSASASPSSSCYGSLKKGKLSGNESFSNHGFNDDITFDPYDPNTLMSSS